MVNLENILKEYPPQLREDKDFHFNILKEFLQAHFLRELQAYDKNNIATFIGGTALRFAWGLDRFSEDLDFDLSVDKEELKNILERAAPKIKKATGDFVIRYDDKGSDKFARIEFPDIIKKAALSTNRTKLWLKIDAGRSRADYPRKNHVVAKFGLFIPLRTPTIEVMTSMKLLALTERIKGRDMYDVGFLLPQHKADFTFLKNDYFARTGVEITHPEEVKELILNNINRKGWDINEKKSEASRFVIDESNISRVEYFKPYIEQLDFSNIFVETNKENEKSQKVNGFGMGM